MESVIIYQHTLEVIETIKSKFNVREINIPFFVQSPYIICNLGLKRIASVRAFAQSLNIPLIIYAKLGVKIKGTEKIIRIVPSISSDDSSDEEEVKLPEPAVKPITLGKPEKPKPSGKQKPAKAKKSTRAPTRSHANSLISSFGVAVTGARNDDFLSGIAKSTSKAMIKIHGDPIGPRAKDIYSIQAFPDLWTRFLNKLGTIPFFSNMTVPERGDWIDEYKNEHDATIGEDFEDTWIEIIQPGDSLLVNSAESEDLETLMNGNPEHPNGWWKYTDIINIIPGNPGSKAARHTLFFIKPFWRIITGHIESATFDGMYFDIFNGTVTNSETTSPPGQKFIVIDEIPSELKATGRGKTKKYSVVDTQSIGFLTDDEMMILNQENTGKLIKDVLVEEGYKTDTLDIDTQHILKSFKNYTPATYKSLLQKLIRFRPTQVLLLDGHIVDTPVILLQTMASLAINPGSFVPDIQRYVSGLESLVKRLGVIIFEDSSTDNNDHLQSIMSSALLIQRVRTWRPSTRIMKNWMRFGVTAWARDVKFEFSIERGIVTAPFTISAGNTALENCSALLDELKSFQGDLGMVRYIASNYKTSTKHWSKNTTIQSIPIMPIWHNVDQHWAPNVAYFVKSSLVEKLFNKAKNAKLSSPFAALFSQLFSRITGFNPRRNYTPARVWDDSDPFVVEIRRAQKLYLISLQQTQTERETLSNSPYTIEYKLDTSWLAGLVGAVEVKGSPAVIVTMKADNPYSFIAIRRPTRNMTVEPLTAEREEAAIGVVKDKLRSGMLLNKATSPSEFLQGAKVYLKVDNDGDEYYSIISSGRELTWEEARDMIISVPYTSQLEDTMENALLNTGTCIEVDAWNLLDELYKDTDNRTMLRALYYLSTYNVNFEMNRINRDGQGTYQTVSIEDSSAFRFLMQLSLIFPAAIRPIEGSPTKFTCPIPPLMWNIRERLTELISENEEYDAWEDVDLYDRRGRSPWEHQVSSIKDMIHTHNSGIKGHFLYLPVGLGKTYIVASYIKYLKDHGKLPPYIIYSLPNSAIQSVAEELMDFGFDVNLLIPLKGKKKIDTSSGLTVSYDCDPRQEAVNLIEHDHLRKCVDVFSDIAVNTVFVFDEVHKMLNDTLRTGSAKQLSRLSKEFIVLTGTPVIDNKVYKLISWLEQIVKFEVNLLNFWCAATIMVSRKASTGIKTVHADTEVKFSPEEMKQYAQYAPFALGGARRNATSDDIKSATSISYKAIDRGIVDATMDYLSSGHNGVMVVAEKKSHQEYLKNLFIQRGIKYNDIYLIDKDKSIFLTDEKVRQGKVHPYKIIITTSRHSTGFTATYMSAFVSGVYFSNEATREQLEGRINRIGQVADTVYYSYIHAGILTYIYQNHLEARNISLAMSDIAQTFVSE